MRPYYRVSVNGTDISSALNGRLIDLTVTDQRGPDADEVTLNVDDSDGLLALPPLGASITVAIGWSADALIDKGAYIADEIGHSGTPDKLEIKGRSADFTGSLKTQRSVSFHGRTLGAIVSAIAQDNGLQPFVSDKYSSILIPHLDQTNESDGNFLSRLAKRYDALATIKEGRLLFMPAGVAESALGTGLQAITVMRQDGDQHHYSQNDRDKYTGVKAVYYDTSSASEQSVLSGATGTIKTLKQRYASQSEAQAAADGDLGRLTRGCATLSYTLAVGRPEIITESPVTVSGFKPEINAHRWIVKECSHSVNESGLTTQLEMESSD